MKLPNIEKAVVPQAKITEYLLSFTHRDGHGKLVTAYPSISKGVITMIRELDSVVLTEALPELGLENGDIGTVVMMHRGGEGYEVEFVTLDGNTMAVTTLLASQVRPIVSGEIAHARLLTAA